MPESHVYYGLIFKKGNFAKISSISVKDYVIHYWWKKIGVDSSFITYYRKNAYLDTYLFSLKHIAN